MAIGPVEYLILGFPGNKFNGDIAPELGKLVDSGTIRILDLVFITKDADGNAAAIDFEDHHDVALFAALDGEVGGFISDEDIEYRGRGPQAELVGRAADLGGPLGGAVRGRPAQLRCGGDRGFPHPPRPDRGRRSRPGLGRLTDRPNESRGEQHVATSTGGTCRRHDLGGGRYRHPGPGTGSIAAGPPQDRR